MRFTIAYLLLIYFESCDNYRILGLFPFPNFSHTTVLKTLLKGLAAKGHEVDVLSHFPEQKQIPRFNDISVRGTMDIIASNIDVSLIEKTLTSIYDCATFMLYSGGVEPCKAVFNSSAARNLLNTTTKYDLVITELFGSDCMLGFAHHFKVPVIMVTTSVILPWGNDRLGNPDNPAYIPNYFLAYGNRMNFKERLINSLVILASKLRFAISSESTNEITRQFFGNQLPDLTDLAYNTSLIFTNSHFSLNNARPIVQNLVEIGGLHITTTNESLQHLEDILNIPSSHKGVIYLSMGSAIASESFSIDKLEAIFEVFEKLPYKVLWKTNASRIPKQLKIPTNIHFEAWLPQKDVLCHPNVKLFISHGGLLGTQESIYCEVPILGIPFFADQESNLRLSEQKGFARVVKYKDITKETIRELVKDLLENPRYKINVEKISRLFKDRPMTPMETAIYWVEYVIRHNGAPHLRTLGTDLPWYQYYLLDVIAAIVLFVMLLFISMCYLVVLLFKKLVVQQEHETKLKKKLK